MFLKILILDVHRQKNFGNLKGSTPKEQYDYYEKKYLNNATYIKSLLQEYPELKRLLELKNNSIQRSGLMRAVVSRNQEISLCRKRTDTKNIL